MCFAPTIVDIVQLMGTNSQFWPPFCKMAATATMGQICDGPMSKNRPSGMF